MGGKITHASEYIYGERYRTMITHATEYSIGGKIIHATEYSIIEAENIS